MYGKRERDEIERKGEECGAEMRGRKIRKRKGRNEEIERELREMWGKWGELSFSKYIYDDFGINECTYFPWT